jgi:5-carboxymethyl-2-hydroxymuconate isomerase
MPHFIIDCSPGILQQKSAGELMQTVYKAAESTGLFAPNDIKVRIRPYEQYLLGEGKNQLPSYFWIHYGRTQYRTKVQFITTYHFQAFRTGAGYFLPVNQHFRF